MTKYTAIISLIILILFVLTNDVRSQSAIEERKAGSERFDRESGLTFIFFPANSDFGIEKEFELMKSEMSVGDMKRILGNDAVKNIRERTGTNPINRTLEDEYPMPYILPEDIDKVSQNLSSQDSTDANINDKEIVRYAKTFYLPTLDQFRYALSAGNKGAVFAQGAWKPVKEFSAHEQSDFKDAYVDYLMKVRGTMREMKSLGDITEADFLRLMEYLLEPPKDTMNPERITLETGGESLTRGEIANNLISAAFDSDGSWREMMVDSELYKSTEGKNNAWGMIGLDRNLAEWTDDSPGFRLVGFPFHVRWNNKENFALLTVAGGERFDNIDAVSADKLHAYGFRLALSDESRLKVNWLYIARNHRDDKKRLDEFAQDLQNLMVQEESEKIRYLKAYQGDTEHIKSADPVWFALLAELDE